MKIYRASKDDYIGQGFSFAEKKEDAKAYLDNPGFGGACLFSAKIPANHKILDLTDEAWTTLSATIGRDITPDMGGYMISQAIQLVPGLLDDIADSGYDWVRYIDDYPIGCVTLTVCSSDAEDIEISEL